MAVLLFTYGQGHYVQRRQGEVGVQEEEEEEEED
jgi:hypothetical protein